MGAAQGKPAGAASARPSTHLSVDGLHLDLDLDVHLLDEVLLPHLETVARAAGDEHRTFVFLAAPPGTGKSVLAALLVHRGQHLDLDAVGLDGFHRPQRYLDSHVTLTPEGPVPLAAVKGAPGTFDTDALAHHLTEGRTRDLAWPVYDRTLHDVVPRAHVVSARLVVVEGNWLLLDHPDWSRLTRFSSSNVFIDADPGVLRDRLIDRKVRGGLSPADAVDFYERSDRRNVERVLAATDRSKVDLMLRLNPDGTITRGECR